MRYICVLGMFVSFPAMGDIVSVGPYGIDATATGLTGSNVLIGQAELGRPGKDGYDSDPNSADGTAPTGVYRGTVGGLDTANNLSTIDAHATEVAGIMISTDASYIGVAPQAQLHSVAVGSAVDAVATNLALNRIATLGNGLVRATNISFIQELQFPDEPDGGSHFTSFVDWSARQHDLLYVVNWGNDDVFEPRAPTDNYNGITVAASGIRENEDSWRSFGLVNSTQGLDFSDSQNIHILAPGELIDVLTLRRISTGAASVQGSSAAAPHVTGAVALLQQFAGSTFPGNANSRRHEVMKAVMMNSADKIAGKQGANRTVCDADIGPCVDWEHSEAYFSPTIPLDDKMGAGALNVRRAVQQLTPGEHSPGTVPLLGWDYGSYGGQGQQAEYVLNASVGADQYITVTLVWDRIVNSTETCGVGTYCEGDQFFSSSVADLNLAIERADGTVLSTSISDTTNFEHIFYKTSGAEDLKITVGRIGFGGPVSGNYAIAWWAGDATSLPGDFNRNGSVGPEDYDVWKTNFGTNFANADGNGNGTVDAGDYTVWRDNFGAGSGSLASIPEPSALLLAAVAFAVGGGRMTRRLPTFA